MTGMDGRAMTGMDGRAMTGMDGRGMSGMMFIKLVLSRNMNGGGGGVGLFVGDGQHEAAIRRGFYVVV